jgi:hypothetical protein
MGHHKVTYISLLICACSLVTSCGQTPELTTVGSGAAQDAPQYVEPTMDVLRGKEQPFPSKYPLSRYPRSRVTYARVRPLASLPPGHTNQVMLSVPEPTKDVIVTYYKQEMKDGGWDLVDKWEAQSYSSTIWRKGDLQVEVRVSPDQYDNQNVQLFYGPAYKRQYPPHQ